MRNLIALATLALTLALQAPAARAAGDLTPGMVQETIRRVSAQYKVSIPFLNQVLQQVPVRRATAQFLADNGSTVGIYFRRTLFLSEAWFDAGGFQVDGMAFGVLVHEAWHAYYDLLMPQPQKRALDQQWLSYYRRAGHSSSQAMVMGDEAIGVYSQTIATLYGFAVKRFTRDRTLNERFLTDYRKNLDGYELYGYDGDVQANVPISAPERAALISILGGAFPSTETLIQTLEQRIPAPAPSPVPTPSAVPAA